MPKFDFFLKAMSNCIIFMSILMSSYFVGHLDISIENDLMNAVCLSTRYSTRRHRAWNFQTYLQIGYFTVIQV